MPDTPVNANNGDSPTATDLPAMPETSPPQGRKTRRPARPTAETGNGEGAATGTAATGGRRAGQRTKKPRTPITAAARSTRPDSAGHRRTRVRTTARTTVRTTTWQTACGAPYGPTRRPPRPSSPRPRGCPAPR